MGIQSSSSYAAGNSTFSSSSIVQAAISRSLKTLFDQGLVPWKLVGRNQLSQFEPAANSSRTMISSLAITQTEPDTMNTYKPLAGDVDESYNLTITTDGKATISAVSSTGVMHGLQTFIQLFYKHSTGAGMYTNLAPVEIIDAPKFSHRGLNMDVARNWFPMENIMRTIDALAMNKFNRLHLHMTDSQSWPMDIPALPDLSKKGAYQAGLSYTPNDIQLIQTYAVERGIEVIIEFDMPGHTTSIGYAYPDLITGFDAKPWDTYCAEPPWDEVNSQVYLLDSTVKSNESSVIGPLIQKLVDRNHIQLRAAGLTPIVWEEMLLDWNLTLGSDVLVQSWLSDASVAAITARGHKALAGNYNFWYLDCGKGQWLDFDNGASFQQFYPFADYCSPTKSWRLVYSYDPLGGVPANQTYLVQGGEVHIWSEQTDPVNLDDMVWPRASAAGEVLWSGRQDASGQNRSQITASPRLAEMRERMVNTGVKVGPVQMIFCHTPVAYSQIILSLARSPGFPLAPFTPLIGRLDLAPESRDLQAKMIEEIFERVSPKTLIVAVIAILSLLKVSQWINTERKIRALGGHAYRVKTWIPGDVDFIIRAIRGTVSHKNLETWTNWFTLPTGTLNYTVEAVPAGRRVLFTADPENIKAILATQFTDYGKGEPFHREWKDFLGDSIFVTDLEQWHNSRQLIRPQFIKDRVSDLEVFERHVQVLMRKIDGASWGGNEKVRGMGKEFDICDLFFRYTLDAATDFLLGRSVGSLEVPEQEFASAFGEVQRVQNLIARAGPFHPLVPRRSFFRGIKIIDDFVHPFIEQTLRLSPEELATKTKSEEGYTFLHALAGFTRDRKVLRDQLVAILLAGRDTTASTLSWTFYELARHPEVMRKLRAEIEETVGWERAPTYEDLKSMKYLQNAMNETLRLYPVVPFNVRLALKDTTLPHGGGPDGLSQIGILKDTPIGYSTLQMQRRPDLTPPIPNPTYSPTSTPTPQNPNQSKEYLSVEDFSPERWQTWQPKPWIYIPFNGGPRICIGQQFALTEMGYTIVRLLQRYERIENFMGVVDGGRPTLKAEIVLQPGDGVRIGLWRRGEKV
ncbi:putative cytochrome 52A4 [Acephala macrosclerotiorum]|nr:putative cytochrome 52A4 [Acephala macrosclerotiorum]